MRNLYAIVIEIDHDFHAFLILAKWSSHALIHWLIIIDRMPVILGDKESSDAWLNGSSSSKYDTILKPYEESDLVCLLDILSA